MIKKIIKKIIPKKIYYKYVLNKYKKNGGKTIEQKKQEISERYFEVFKRKIDWDNPQTYTEKINVSKLLCSNKEKTTLTDKLLVRNWVKEKLGEEYLIPLLGVYNNYNEIDFSKLPDSFVIKCNHDSGSVTICNDKKTINQKKIKQKYDFCLKANYADIGYEMHYKDIKPKILIEKNMGIAIKDYKFLCFDGKPYYCWVDIDRYGNHKRNVYDLEWNLQEFQQMDYGNSEEKLDCPEQFEEMKRIAKKLSEGFDHVRVDLYLIDGKIYFGEMTFTNGSGFEKIQPDEWDYKLGNLWTLDRKGR